MATTLQSGRWFPRPERLQVRPPKTTTPPPTSPSKGNGLSQGRRSGQQLVAQPPFGQLFIPAPVQGGQIFGQRPHRGFRKRCQPPFEAEPVKLVNAIRLELASVPGTALGGHPFAELRVFRPVTRNIAMTEAFLVGDEPGHALFPTSGRLRMNLPDKTDLIEPVKVFRLQAAMAVFFPLVVNPFAEVRVFRP